jgi:hypothetical protein
MRFEAPIRSDIKRAAWQTSPVRIAWGGPRALNLGQLIRSMGRPSLSSPRLLLNQLIRAPAAAPRTSVQRRTARTPLCPSFLQTGA